MSGTRNTSSVLTLFLLYFCYATCTALLFQKFVVPLVPALHAGYGLLVGDSGRFHEVAVDLAQQIRTEGWSAWNVYPTTFTGLNTAILAALYVFFGIDPALIIPINAALHALSGVLIAMIARMLWPDRVGIYSGVIAGTLFVMFPSTLNWYGQVHKDGFAIAGTLLVIYGWLRLGRASVRSGKLGIPLALLVAGALLVLSVRPYQLMIVAAALGLTIFVSLAASKLHRTLQEKSFALAMQSCAAVCMVAVAALSPHSQAVDAYVSWQASDFQWEDSTWLPGSVENRLEALARTRVGMITTGKQVGAESLIDAAITPGNAAGVVAYFPRAAQIALFAPFPRTWLEKLSATRLVALAETMIWYLLAPGVLIALYYRRTPEIACVLLFAAMVLTVYGFTLANVGTLYRVRYPYLFMFVMAGVAGWTELLLKRAEPVQPGVDVTMAWAAAASPEPSLHAPDRKSIVSSGLVVAIFTGVGYLGFFARDVIMARMLGVGRELDAFLVATVLPMFLVAVFAVPLAGAVVPSFMTAQQLGRRESIRFVNEVMFASGAFTLGLAVLLAIASPVVLPQVAASFPADKLSRTAYLMLWMLPILALSAPIVVANGVLNALGRYSWPAAAQASVAILAIIVFVALGHELGALAAILGMFAGQLLNCVIVMWLLYREDILGRPAIARDLKHLRPLFIGYVPLVAGALFVNLAVPVNMGMAAVLSEGAVSALGLGNKVVLFVGGVVGTAVATVLLPHFSRVLVRHGALNARRELSFFISAATVLTIPISIALLLGGEALVGLLFFGGRFASDDVHSVARVVEYGVLQIPFFTVNALLLKFAIATHRPGRVTFASLLGLCVNIGLNLLLMPRLGAPGIALATTLALTVSTAILLLLFHHEGHVSWVDLLSIGLSWMLFITLAVCLHYHSYPGVIATLLALGLLLFDEWRRLIHHRSEVARPP